jgi:hypothetical protein
LPNGTVTGTAAPLRAATWRLFSETVGVVEHLPRSPRHWSRGINMGAGVNLLFLPPQCLLLPLLPCLLRFAAGPRNREGTPPLLPSCTPAPLLADVRHLHLPHRRRCSSSGYHRGEIGSLTASSPPLHRGRSNSGKLFLLCSSSLTLFCSHALATSPA